MKIVKTLVVSLTIAFPGFAIADEETPQLEEVDAATDSAVKAEADTASATEAIDTTESSAKLRMEDLTGEQRRALDDQAWNQAAEEYNEQARSEADEVVCERVTVTGSRQKKRICRTVRDIENSEEASQRMLKRSNRSGTVPAAGELQGSP
jgi:myo-inositol-hexaphosphate 3-phosphohydrolase